MSNTTMMPCPQWGEKLAKVHPDDLSLLEREELEAHLATCPTCATIRAQYNDIAALLDALPAGNVPENLPPKLAQLWEEEANPRQLHKPAGMHTRGASPIGAPTTRRKKRLTSLMSAIAAVLIAGILLGTVVTHLSGNNQSGRSSGGTILGGPNVTIADTPVFWHSNVYIFTGTVIAAFHSNNGSLIRTYNIGNSKYSRIKPSTPVIVDGIMYVIGTTWPDPTTFGFDSIYALRLSDGALLWHTPVNDTKMLPPAIANAITVVDGIVYATVNAHTQYLYALRASDGALLWKYKAGKPDDAVISLPSVAYGVAYVGVVLDTQNALDKQNANVVALNTQDGKLLWQRKVEGEQFVKPAVIDGVVYASSQGVVSELRIGDGSLLWRYHVSGSFAFPSIPTVVNGIAYFVASTTSDGYIYALRAHNGTLLWRHQLMNSSSFM
ncbi:MAG TPA: PQQ-binding-like beta-propeller repeat protein, partial [Ktedonobacteraceae bacterium]|nr:PQQ-binding-like beta-propeller repeat protein [Ktedonobacteraceae bacterium]